MRQDAICVLLLSLLLSAALIAACVAAPLPQRAEDRPRGPAASFESVAALHAALAADSALLGRDVTVEAVLVADFFRDVYLNDPVSRDGPGLRVATGEHLAELGQRVVWRGLLALEEDELFLDARRAPGGVAEPWRSVLRLYDVAHKITRQREARTQSREAQNALALSPARLLAEPEALRGRLLRVDSLLVTKISRDANDVPWLMSVESGKWELSVELQDGQHPLLAEGDALLGLRGIWQRQGEYWNLRPRFTDDFLLADAGDFRGERPPRRDLWQRGRQLARNHVRGEKAPRGGSPLLDEICYDPWGPGDGEGAESFAVLNAGDGELDLRGWSVTDNEGSWIFPRGALLRPGERLHVARDDERFFFEFGFPPDFSFDEQPSPGDSALILDNDGDELLLLDPWGRLADAVVFEDGWADAQEGWEGPALRPYRFNVYVPEEGQVLWRKRFARRDGELPGGGRASDWICDPRDPLLGQGLAFPGWDLAAFREPVRCRERAELTAFVSPDNSFAGLRDFLRSARESLEIELYLFTHPLLADELLAAMDRGVRVRVLLNGEVFGARGGTYNSVRAIARMIAGHPSGLGHVYFWRNGDDPRHGGMDTDIPDRYNHCHQKFIIADRERVLIGSDNLTQSSLPADDAGNGSNGSRGLFLVTDASCIVERAALIFEADCDPRRHRDIRRYVSREGLAERDPRPAGDRQGYRPVQAAPFTARQQASFELTQSPENALHPERGYLGLVNRAQAGDWILIEQQYERPWWGFGDRTIANPRLAAYVEAARRGASLRIILNGAGGQDRNCKNAFTRDLINFVASEEDLDLTIVLGSLPGARQGSDRPIHNKMLLARIGDQCWSHVGSANGSETAHRYNRELGLSIESQGLFKYLAEVFRFDWERAREGAKAAGGPGHERLFLPERWVVPSRR